MAMTTTRDELSLRDVEELFSPFLHRKFQLPTRLVMAPMTRGFSPDGVPGEDVAAYYGRRAENEVGLIITEGTLIDEPSSSGDVNWPHMYGGRALRGWKAVCEAVHRSDCKIASQLWHVGMARQMDAEVPNPQCPPIGPSGIELLSLRKTQPEMSLTKIAEVIDAYARAAATAKKLGFDAVEIHGAHGYLIDQFLWSETNHRSDSYGGDHVGRTRFAREVVQAVRKAVGSQFPIIFRFSQWKLNHYEARLAETPEQLADILLPLSEAGVDIFHASTHEYDIPAFEGSHLNLAGWAKKISGKPSITVGSVGLDCNYVDSYRNGSEHAHATSIERVLQRLSAGEFDLVAVGRALLADPEWGSKIHAGQDEAVQGFSKRDLARLR